MKKLFVLAVPTVAVLLASCGSSKNTATNDLLYQMLLTQQKTSTTTQQKKSGLGIEKEKSPAQIYAEDPNRTTLRAYGSANALPNMYAKEMAADVARGALAAQLATLVERGSAIAAGQHQQGASSSETRQGVKEGQGKGVKEGQGKNDFAVRTFAQELIRYAREVKENTYVQEDGSETSYVCVEISIPEVVTAIRSNQEFQEVINDEAKLKIDYQSQQFQKTMEAAFEELKRMKQE